MPRRVATLLVFVLTAVSGRVPALHVHSYNDHDHPEHHHGLADHEHAVAPHADDDVARLDECEPGRHAVSIAVAGAAPAEHHDAAGETLTGAIPPLTAGYGACGGIKDVRVHGPPPVTQASPRAPPLIHPA